MCKHQARRHFRARRVKLHILREVPLAFRFIRVCPRAILALLRLLHCDPGTVARREEPDWADRRQFVLVDLNQQGPLDT